MIKINNQKKNLFFYKHLNNSIKIIEKKQLFKHNKKIIKQMNQPHSGSIFFPNHDGFIVQLKNVSKWYLKDDGVFSALEKINLEIKEGEYVVILGASGSGKTSLLNIISGLERSSNGQVIVNNHNLITMTEKKLTDFRRKFIGLIFQSYLLLSNLKIKENIQIGFELSNYFSKKLNIEKIIEQLDLVPHLNKYPHQLSGGQQQRVSIARALAKQPKILFADEPTGAVDEETAFEILKLISEINKNHKTTIIMVTHNYSISKLATKIIYIKDGQINNIKSQFPITVEEWYKQES